MARPWHAPVHANSRPWNDVMLVTRFQAQQVAALFQKRRGPSHHCLHIMKVVKTAGEQQQVVFAIRLVECHLAVFQRTEAIGKRV